MKFWGLALGLIFTQIVLAQKATPECREFQIAGTQGQVCIYKPANWNGKQIAYHMHGAGGNALRWNEIQAYKNAMQILDQKKIARPLVVGISLGEFWLLKDFDSNSGLPPMMLFTRVQQDIEAEFFGGRAPEKRILIGESMGGYNSLLLLGKGVFTYDKAAVLCPAFGNIGPYSTEAEIQAYINRHKPYVNPSLVIGLIDGLREDFPTQAEWNRHAPFYVASLMKGKKTNFYVSGNTRDEFGFGEGAELLRNELQKAGVSVKYELIAGRHCVMNSNSIADFFSK